MEKISCNVIKDLLPLYEDGFCSDETKKLVENHISECEDCKRELENIKKCPVFSENDAKEFEAVKKAGKKIKKSRKKAVIKAVCISLVVCIALGIFTACEFVRSSLEYSFWNSPVCTQGASQSFNDNPSFSYTPKHNGQTALGNCKINLPKKYENVKYEKTEKTTEYSKSETISVSDDFKEKSITVTYGKYTDYGIAAEDSFGTGFFDRLSYKLVDKGAKLSGYKGINDDEFRYYLYLGEPPEFYDGIFASPKNKLKSFAFFCGTERCVPLFTDGFKICNKTDDGYIFGSVFISSQKDGTDADYRIMIELPQKNGVVTNIHFRNFTFNEAKEVMASLKY